MGNKVLLIDDDPEFVDAMTTLLEAKGMRWSLLPMAKTVMKKECNTHK